MKQIFLKVTLSIILSWVITLNGQAQLANWSQTSGSNFPTNNVGQINGMTRISQLKHHPTDSLKMYAVTAEGGLFTTTDKGNNWAVKAGTENLTGSCASICIDYTNEQNILLGTGDANYYSNGSGVLKSTDGGTTFNTTSLTNALVVHIIQNPLNSSQYIAATNKGIYKSTNNGTTWTAKTGTTLQFVDLKMNPGTNSQTLYACTRDNNSRLYKSYNFGDTWTELLPGFTYPTTYTTGGARIGLTQADTNVVYFEMIGGGGIVYKSNNGGTTFRLKKAEGVPYINFYDQNGPSGGLTGQGNYNNAIWVDKTNPARVWLQSHNTWYSVDSGATWTQLTHWASKVHTDMHQLQQAPFNNNLLISCNDGGIWFSTDGGNNWTPKCNGIGAFEIANNAGISALTDKDFVSIGTQDNARLYGTAAGWFTISGGDDYAKRVADFNGFIYYDGVNRQTNLAGSSGTYNLPTTNWNAFAFNRTDKNLGFMGVNDVWRTNDLSASSPTWTQISTFNNPIRAISSCISDANRLYVLTMDGNIYVSTNALSATPTFTFYIVGGFSAFSTGSVVAMANNADIVYVQEDNKVYRSSNGGQNWTDITYNLPNVNHRRILAEQYGGTTELVFIATNNAVYYKKAGQTTWTNYSTSLPGRRSPTEFSMYDDETNNSKIRYATYGRSMWETKFGNLRELKANFDVAQTYYCTPGQAIQFKDQSIGNTTSWSWTFPGGTPSSSNVQNPTVTYASGGVYSAFLTVSDGSNSSSYTRLNYITVLSSAPKTNTGCSLTSNSNLSNPYGIGISYFSLGTIDNITSSGNGYYNDYACSKYTILTPGASYNATITTGTVNPEGANVYIDWNDNGNLETSEAVVSYPSNKAGTRTLSFTVPTTGVALNKGLRLRVISKFNSVPSSACDVGSYGQAEDYMVYVQPTTSAVLSNGSGSSTICGSGSSNLKLTISGGTSPYTVVISNGTTTQTINNYVSGADIPVSPTTSTTYSVASVMDNVYYFMEKSGSATVNVELAPTASAGGSTTICSNAAATVSGATATNGTIAWTHNGTGSITAGAITLTPTYTAAAGDGGNAVTLTMTVTGNSSCTATATYTVNINAAPSPTMTGLNTEYCKTSGLITLAASPSGGSFMVDGLAATSFDTDVLSVGAHSVSYTYTAANTCSATVSQNINVLAIPAAPVITSNAVSPQCLNSTVTLTAPAADKYAWYQDGAFLKWTNSPTNTLMVTATTSTKNYSVYTYNAATNFCPSDVSNSISVLGTAPVSVITPSSAAPYCANNAPVLSAIPPTGSGYTYSWTCPTCSTTMNSPTMTPTAQTGDYYVTVTDANGCSRTSPKLNVVLNAVPVANAGADLTACMNTTTPLGGATASLGYSYSWLPATNLSATNVAKPNVTATSTTPITYTFRVTRTTTGCYSEDQVVVTGASIPDAATLTASSSAAVCSPATITLTPSVSNSVFWYKNGILMSGIPSTGAKVISTSAQPSDAYTIANYNGTCKSAQSAPVNVTINTAPKPTITSTPAVVVGGSSVVSICNGQTTGTADLVASVPSGSPMVSSYNWQQAISGVNTNLSPAVTTSNYTASVAASPASQNNKSFRVQANYANGCFANSVNVLVKLLPVTCIVRMNGEQEEALNEIFRAYPNPTADKLTVSLENYGVSEGELLLYNNLGQLVLKQSVSLTEGRAEESLDLSSLAAGMYNLVFQTKDGQSIQKIVKE